MYREHSFLLIIIIAIINLPSFNLYATVPVQVNDFDIEADILTYSKECDTIIADGNAKLTYQQKTLSANKIIYLQNTREVLAKGSVILKNDNGDLHHFQSLNINVDLEHGNAIKMQSKLKDNVLLSANKIDIKNKNIQEISKLTFSPCSICSNNIFSDRPLWQLRAKSATIDREKDRISLKGATVDYLGHPILYLPYAMMNTPNAKRRSGFLVPKLHELTASEEFGWRFSIPYYFNIAPNMDATFSPKFSTKINTQYDLNFRHLTKYGSYHINTNFIMQPYQIKDVTYQEQLSGYISALGKFNTNDMGRDINYGFNINRLFDKTKQYLKKYQISETDIFTTHIYANTNKVHSSSSHLISAELLSFQDLRPDADSKETADALPLLRYYHRKKINFFNSEFNISSKAYNLIRRSENNESILLTDFFLTTPFQTENGHLFKLKNGLYIDLRKYNQESKISPDSKSRSYIIPYTQLSWQWPLLMGSTIIEPVAALTFTERKFYSSDPSLLEIRNSNFFAPNRFPDWQSIDFYSRLDYGVNVMKRSDKDQYLSIFIGASKKLENALPNKLSKQIYINNISLQLSENIYFINRLTFDSHKMHVAKHEFDSIFSSSKFSADFNYTYTKPDVQKRFPQEIGFSLDYNFYQNWWVNLNSKVKFNNAAAIDIPESKKAGHKKKILEEGIGITYKDDCLRINFAVKRGYIKADDLKPSVTYTLSLGIPIFG